MFMCFLIPIKNIFLYLWWKRIQENIHCMHYSSILHSTRIVRLYYAYVGRFKLVGLLSVFQTNVNHFNINNASLQRNARAYDFLRCTQHVINFVFETDNVAMEHLSSFYVTNCILKIYLYTIREHNTRKEWKHQSIVSQDEYWILLLTQKRSKKIAT